MKNLLVWGTGGACESFHRKYHDIFYSFFDIVGYIDTKKDKQGKYFYNKRIYSPEQIHSLEWDMILLCTVNRTYQDEMLNFLQNMGVERTKIACFLNCEGIGLMRDFIFEKYKDTEDGEIQSMLQYIEGHELSVFNTELEKKKKSYKVYSDSYYVDPYVFIDDKRMYYPKEFLDIKTTPFVYDIYGEQSLNSPHLYVPFGTNIQNNSVIVDVGAREGNFSLKYIENSKKTYIIECEKAWCRALSKTFAPYRDKVEICNAYVGKTDDGKGRTIDSLIKDSVDFLKMDIEGAEVDALKGAKRLLGESRAFCSICAYHNENDEKNIKTILHEYGYTTEVSHGYMLFGWDKNFYTSLDIRRGVVYGEKFPVKE